MQLHQLRYLRAVIRTGSVTAAAQSEHVAQPSISKQLRLLEHELGTPLFHRVGRRVVPTDAALALADCADRVFDDLAATVDLIAGPAGTAGGSLRLCATETLTNNLLPAALSIIRAESPSARIRVEMLGTDDAIARVVADEFDLALLVLPLRDSRLDVHSLRREPILLAVAPGHPWAAEPRSAVAVEAALGAQNLLLSMPGHGLRSQVEEVANAHGIALEAWIELRSVQALLAMVASGGGIAFVPAMSVAGRTDVVGLPLDPPLDREVGWVRRPGRHLPAIALRLLTLLGEPGPLP